MVDDLASQLVREDLQMLHHVGLLHAGGEGVTPESALSSAQRRAVILVYTHCQTARELADATRSGSWVGAPARSWTSAGWSPRCHRAHRRYSRRASLPPPPWSGSGDTTSTCARRSGRCNGR